MQARGATRHNESAWGGDVERREEPCLSMESESESESESELEVAWSWDVELDGAKIGWSQRWRTIWRWMEQDEGLIGGDVKLEMK